MGFFLGIPPGPTTTAEVVAGAMTKNAQFNRTKQKERENMGTIEEKAGGEGERKAGREWLCAKWPKGRSGRCRGNCPREGSTIFSRGIC